MNDDETIQAFKKLLGQTIVDIRYIETKFYYDLHGDWTAVNSNSFVLHSPEWEIILSNGQKWFFINNHSSATETESSKSNITITSYSIAKTDDKIHNVPNTFDWKDILQKEIIAIRFYKRIIHTKKFLGYEIGKVYQDNFQIIEFLCSNKSFFITTMNGDIGQMNFYPTGYLGDRLGIFFNKTIVDNYTVYSKTNRQIDMRMEMVYQVTKK